MHTWCLYKNWEMFWGYFSIIHTLNINKSAKRKVQVLTKYENSYFIVKIDLHAYMGNVLGVIFKRMLELKQLEKNTSNSKFVIIGQKQSWRELIKEAENNPIKMGHHTLEIQCPKNIWVTRYRKTGQLQALQRH